MSAFAHAWLESRALRALDLARVDPEGQVITDHEDQEINDDLLVSIPVNKGDELIARSGPGNEYNLVPTEKHTLVSKTHDNIFVIGDATDLPSSKAGAVAHFEADILLENMQSVKATVTPCPIRAGTVRGGGCR